MGRPAKNLVGNQYGKLTVLERDNTKTKEPHYHCQCECGNKTTVRASNLTRTEKPTNSCGCLRTPPPSPERIDLTGHIFGNLIAISASPLRSSNNKKTSWFCQCSCGNVTLVRTDSLTSGTTVSCGCITRSKKGHPRTPPTCTPAQRAWHNLVERGDTGLWGCKEQFIEVMGERPSPVHVLTKYDTREPHGPNNTIWSTCRAERDQYSMSDNEGIDIGGLLIGGLNSLTTTST
jgi:hypothetical protein